MTEWEAGRRGVRARRPDQVRLAIARRGHTLTSLAGYMRGFRSAELRRRERARTLAVQAAMPESAASTARPRVVDQVEDLTVSRATLSALCSGAYVDVETLRRFARALESLPVIPMPEDLLGD